MDTPLVHVTIYYIKNSTHKRCYSPKRLTTTILNVKLYFNNFNALTPIEHNVVCQR